MEPDRLARALALRDLTDPAAGPHALQHVVSAIEHAGWGVPVRHVPGPRVVSTVDNYDRLRYSQDAVTRDRRYSRYVGSGKMLRSHTTAHIPALLDELSRRRGPDDVILSVPGICYRRDAIDRHHVGEPHQMDLWRIRRGGPALSEVDLMAMVGSVVRAVLPDAPWHTVPSLHPYTLEGREIYAAGVEIGECGLAHPELLPPGATGLAMGLGVDRLAMLAKGIDDIRLLRSTDPRVVEQMGDLRPYHPVSSMPATSRDLSLAVAADVDAELLGDRVRDTLGPDAVAVEEVAILTETAYDDLPATARRRMGLRSNQKNILVRVTLRDLSRTITSAHANALRDRIYAALHEGGSHEWAIRARR